MNDALIVQQCNSSGEFFDSMRLTYQRHATYAIAHQMDYWHIIGDMLPDKLRGGWDKVNTLKHAIEVGYKMVFWIDADACIVNHDFDLREAFTGAAGDIGACIHDANGIPKHHNVGILFIRNTQLVHAFFHDWLESYPADVQWMEQGAFNSLMAGKYKGLLFTLDDKFNSTYRVNESKTPVISAWHGVRPLIERYNLMAKVCAEDYINFRVI